MKDENEVGQWSALKPFKRQMKGQEDRRRTNKMLMVRSEHRYINISNILVKQFDDDSKEKDRRQIQLCILCVLLSLLLWLSWL